MHVIFLTILFGCGFYRESRGYDPARTGCAQAGRSSRTKPPPPETLTESPNPAVTSGALGHLTPPAQPADKLYSFLAGAASSL